MKTIETVEDVYKELQDEDIHLYSVFSFKKQKKILSMSLGRIWFNLLFPDDFELIDYDVNKNDLRKIFNKVYEKYSSEKAIETITKVNQEASVLGTILAPYFDLEAITIPKEILAEQKKLQAIKDPVEFQNKIKELGDKLLNYYKTTNQPVYWFIKSKAKVSEFDVATMLLGRGATVDFNGRILNPIPNSINSGFNLSEFYQVAREGRYMLYVRALGASEPGALSRNVVYANSGTMIGSKDCKTKKYLKLKITENNVRSIIGRYYLNKGKLEIITQENTDSLIDKVIEMRSPLYCKEPGDFICQTCYGDFYKQLNNKYIGVLAGTVIAGVGIDLFSMKARHSTSQVKVKPVDFTKDLQDL